jgi:hypothetical protein
MPTPTPRQRRPATRGKPPRREPAWVRLSDEELLQKRFCDLRLTLRGSAVERQLGRLRRDLERRGIRARPHVWLSEEWFTPDGVPGFAIPFYLVHPRLRELERRLMKEVEGGNAKWMRRILRHELGHALDNAFRLRRRKEWRRVFGRASRPYPDAYRPRPASRSFVLHLGHWYAQCHPAEDFAETFAVWMQPKARWRRDYEGWPALRKLEYVDALMQEIRGKRPPVLDRSVVEPIHENRRTLAQHYRRKRALYALDSPETWDGRLLRVFARRRPGARRSRASTLLRESRPELQRLLERRSRLHPYLVQHVVESVIQRCRDLDLVLSRSKRESKRAMLGVLERILLETLRRDRERFAL